MRHILHRRMHDAKENQKILQGLLQAVRLQALASQRAAHAATPVPRPHRRGQSEQKFPSLLAVRLLENRSLQPNGDYFGHVRAHAASDLFADFRLRSPQTSQSVPLLPRKLSRHGRQPDPGLQVPEEKAKLDVYRVDRLEGLL